MFKLTGCLLIFISCFWLGHIKAYKYSERRKELENTIEIIKLMEMDITYKKEPLVKTFQHAASSKKCWFSKVLESGSSMLKEQNSLMDSWSYAINSYGSNIPLEKEDMDIIEDLVIGLGKSSADDQRKVLEYVSIRLSSNLEKAHMQEEKLGRMYKAMGTAVGIVLVILII